ncbi:MAG: glycosyltransferase family 4 protein [Spirochaetes bacterium]|nr:glycosyltransferase family 4 protein [Spirochaetota bacterium]
MKILYDHQVFEIQNIGGISRYFSELLKRNLDAKLSLRYTDNVYLREECFKQYNLLPRAEYKKKKFLTKFNFKGKGRLINCYNYLFNKKSNKDLSNAHVRRRNDYTVFHPTYYDPYFLKHLKGKPFVLTVYDMIHECLQNFFHSDKHTIPHKAKLILAADQIITISDHTKNDLIKFFPEVQEKINVVYLASSFPEIEYISKKENYILFTGARWGYKNFDTFSRAVAPLLKKYDMHLICTGALFSDDEMELLNSLGIADRTISKYAALDNELIKLYSKASAFVFPSLYEGFGIPVLEAFATNCPAVLSNTSSLPEVGGDAALYFNPYSIDDMRTQIERVICSPTLQNELIIKGKKRIKIFSWEKCYQETIEVYKKAL